MLLGQTDEARRALQGAVTAPGATTAAMATTRRQLRLLLRGQDADLLSVLENGLSLHFCGRMFDEHAEVEATLAERIDAFLEGAEVQAAFGSLAAGADILIAERLLARGIPVTCVLATEPETFKDTSVAICAGDWPARFDRVLAQVSEVVVASDTLYLSENETYNLATDIAMGLARRHASETACKPFQLALTDAAPRDVAVGTNHDIARWAARGDGAEILRRDDLTRKKTTAPHAHPSPARAEGVETIRAAILFADLKGFTTIPPADLLPLARASFTALAGILAPKSEDVIVKNTWGDACFLALRSPAVACEVAFELQDLVQNSALAEQGCGLRISLHYGVVSAFHDPVIARTNILGPDVSRAARIEPVTPPGAIYASRRFLAALSNAGAEHVVAEYLGETDLAKRFGNEKLYALRRAPTAEGLP